MRILRIWVAYFMVCGAAWAQNDGVLEGVIKDADGGPLAGANVLAHSPELGMRRGATTDADGRYRIQSLSAGQYDVTVSFIGYKSKAKSSVLISQGIVSRENFVLESEVYMQGQIVVSASRRREKAIDAPAAVSVVESDDIANRAATSVSDFVKGLPGVDSAPTGLSQSNTVARGFNNVFSGAMLTLVDNRIASVPSLRLNANNFIPITDDDIERIEIVLGPGAALYGPTSANGVMHIISKSPFQSVGTSIQATGGERSMRKVGVRHAGRLSDKVAYKISGQYFGATDWKYEDPEEVRARGVNPRDYDQKRKTGEFRLDFKPTKDLTAILSAGYNSADNIDMTGLGAGQAKDWTYEFVQGRVLYKGWFAQAFYNKSDAGKTTLLRSGNPIVDRSTLSVFQLQHAVEMGPKQFFTYGVDAQFTRPNTEGTINGIHESTDGIDEYGFYVQSETALTEQLDFILAGRIDDHKYLEDPVFSPRAAIVFKPRDEHTLRVTYNRAFDTPSSNNLFLDLKASPDVFGIGQSFLPAFGFSPTIDVRTQGTTTGFTFKRDANGFPMFRSPFAPVAGLEKSLYASVNDPQFTNLMWGVARGAVLAGLTPQLQQVATGVITQQLITAGVPADQAPGLAAAQAAQLAAAFPGIIPSALPGLQNSVGHLNLATRGFDFVSDIKNAVADVARIRPTITETFEVGYKGIAGNNLVMAADVYRSKKKDFVGPLRVETPNVFLEPTSLAGAFGAAVAQNLANPANALLAQAVGALDAPSLGGNGNGTAVDELTSVFVSSAAKIPFGTLSPEQAVDPTAVMLTYRNFGQVTYYGADVSCAYYANEVLTISGNYSYVSDDLFENLDGIADIALNAPKHKANLAVKYAFPNTGFRVEGSMRYRDGFPMDSGVYVGPVKSYTVFDALAAYEMSLSNATRMTFHVNVSNLADKRYTAFVGAPDIGRLASAGISLKF
jgi:outer membrane receptor for ferrienterochelin and colicins